MFPVKIVWNKLLGSFAGRNEIHAEYSSLFSDACYVYIFNIFKDLKPYVVQAPVRLWRPITYILLIHVKIQDIYFIRDRRLEVFYK